MTEFNDLLTHQEQREPLAPAPEIHDVEHVTVRYEPSWYCAHPRWGVYRNFGGGEMIVGFKMAPSDYMQIGDVLHGNVSGEGYEARATIIMQRTTDGGQTWPRENDVVLYREFISDDEKRAFLYQMDAPREPYDMFSPDSVFWFTHTYLHDEQRMVCFGLRSADRGRTWEKVPTVVGPPPGKESLRKKFSTVVRRPDGKALLTLFNDGTSPLYKSTDQGLNWQFVTKTAVDPTGVGAFTYEGLLQLPNGDLQSYQCYFGQQTHRHDFRRNTITMSSSADGGEAWTIPTPIVGKGSACWDFSAKYTSQERAFYRSPFPILLDDGRILVLWARRRAPFGIGGTISCDGGTTWSHEFVVRGDDVRYWDHGYGIGSQLEDGRIFFTYYYHEPDKPNENSVRYIDSSFFRIE